MEEFALSLLGFFYQPEPFLPLMLIVFLVLLVLLFAYLLIRGNLLALKLLNRLGFTVLSGQPERDYRLLRAFNPDLIGWLSIGNTCYAPILSASKGFYRRHDYRRRPSSHGELHISDGNNTLDLQHIARPSTGSALADLTIVSGSALVHSSSLRQCQFTLLSRYILSDLKNSYPTVVVCDKGKLRFFEFLFAVKIGIEDRKSFQFSDRASFLSSLRALAFVDSGRQLDHTVILLNASSVLDTLLVLLVEKDGGAL